MQIEIDKSKILNSVLVVLITGAVMWAWNLQGRITRLEQNADLTSRIVTLENLIFPIAVEFEIRKRVGEIESSIPTPISPATLPSPLDPMIDAEAQVRSMIEQRSVEEARERTGEEIRVKSH